MPQSVDSHDREDAIAVEEGIGDTIGKAKWTAVRELQKRYHGVTGEDVQFEVMEEPVTGQSQAVIRASLDIERWEGSRGEDAVSSEPVEMAREIVSRIVHEMGVTATVSVEEDEDEIRVQVNGQELGPFIGKSGRTIDAIQAIVSQAAYRRGSKKRAIVDAAGYREKRERSLQREADRAAAQAIRYDRPVELDPMRAGERRIIHMHLADSEDVETESDGKEPNRCVVIIPAGRKNEQLDRSIDRYQE